MALALAVEALIALLLLQLGTGVFHKVEQPKLTTFDVKPIGPPVSKQASKTKVKTQQKKVVTTASAAPPPPTVPPLPKAPLPSKLIQISPEDFAASDIGKIKGAKGDGDGEGTGKDSVAAYGPGEGPGGGAMYNAEWYREPSDAELAPYMRDYVKNGTGWALIACRTAPDYRVENCRALDESPPGGGLARALRLAAWQFRVRPPRANGKALIGAWVKIRFDLTVGFRK
jgi:protein TonB